MSAPDFPAAVLFDHDGTLVNSEPQWAVAKRAVAGRYGVGWSTEDDLATMGRQIGITSSNDLLKRTFDVCDMLTATTAAAAAVAVAVALTLAL